MKRLRRFTALAVTISAVLPAAASAVVTTCPSQPTLNAWAGSPKALTIATCTTTNGDAVYTVVAPLAAKGTATAPNALGGFTFTGTFNPAGADPTGDNTVTLNAVDNDGAPGITFTVTWS